MHVRDTSNKVRAIVKARVQNGERVSGFAPYGYEAIDGKLIVNEETAPVVKMIFELCMSGIGIMQIAEILEEKKILNPAAYSGRQATDKTVAYPYKWAASTIGRVLERKEYLGHTIAQKSFTKSYKDKRRHTIPEDERPIVKDTHEAIIDEETLQLYRKYVKIVGDVQKWVKRQYFRDLYIALTAVKNTICIEARIWMKRNIITFAVDITHMSSRVRLIL